MAYFPLEVVKMNEIRFYLREDEYGFLSNFDRTGFKDDLGIW